MDSSAENTTNNVLRFGVNEAMVDKAMPNSQKQVDWLKRYGASLTI